MQYQDSSARFTIAKVLLSCSIKFYSFVLLFFLQQREDFHARVKEKENVGTMKSGKGMKRNKKEDRCRRGRWRGKLGKTNSSRPLAEGGGERDDDGCNGLRIATIEEFSLPFKRTR